ncbi:MAG: CHASE domain-containing protein [Candidatus Tectimicrobiota bacterium]
MAWYLRSYWKYVRSRWPGQALWWTAGGGLALSCLVFALLQGMARHRLRDDLRHTADIYAVSLQTTLAVALEQVEALGALHAAVVQFDRLTFRDFVLPQLQRPSGLNALEWVPVVPAAERLAYEAAAQGEGFPTFHFTEQRHPGTLVPVAWRAVYYPVYYQEPLLGNNSALGFDLGSDSTRLEALQRARDTGRLVLTPRVLLVQETQQERYSILAVRPIYRRGVASTTPEERRQHLVGFGVGTLRLSDMFTQALAAHPPHDIDLALYDLEAPADRQLLHAQGAVARYMPRPLSTSPAGPTRHGLHYMVTFVLGERRWAIVAEPAPSFFAARQRHLPALVGGVLLALTSILTLSMWRQRRSQAQLDRLRGEYAGQMAQANAVVQETTLWLELAQQAAHLGMWTVEAGAQAARGSVNLFRLFDLEPPADGLLTRAAMLQRLYPEDRERLMVALRAFLQDGKPCDIVYRVLWRDGSVHWLHSMGKVFTDARGGFLRRAGATVDITERRRAEADLQQAYEVLEQRVRERTSELRQVNRQLMLELEERAKTAQLFRAVATGVSVLTGVPFLQSLVTHLAQALNVEYVFVGEVIDPPMERIRTTVVYAQGSMADNFAYDLRGTPCEQVVGKQLCSYPRLVAEQFPEDTMLRDMRIQGYVGAPLFDSTGRALGLLVVLSQQPLQHVERTSVMLQIFAARAAAELDRLQAEQALQLTQAQLLAQQQRQTERVAAELARTQQQLVQHTRLATIGQVAASIAHELRNPLGAVRNAAYLLRRRLRRDGTASMDYLEIITTEIASADQIIRNLLEMSRGTRPVKRPVLLSPLLDESRRRLGLSPQIVWQCTTIPTPFEIWADAGQLQQVFSNLFMNAAQAMGPQGRLEVAAHRTTAYDCITVTDSGPGVPADLREQLFEPLVTSKAQGTGLGLTICRQIIERHGGSITFVEPQGAGATVCIRLPCRLA